MSIELIATPEELRSQFTLLETIEDVATMLDVELSSLCYHTQIAKSSSQYKSFTIPKKSGGVRTIEAPISALKIIQWKLNQVLQAVYFPKAPVHGFVQKRNILTNANRHLEFKARKYVLNIDLSDFFHSISFIRIQGLFKAEPYDLPDEVARILASICCCNGHLPQGAPTSPVISNMICAKMDTQLRRLAQTNKSIYTRYADDITFSTSLPFLPSALAIGNDATGQLQIGNELQTIIQNNGFSINTKKVKLQTKDDRQEVTGLTINKFPNVSRRYVRQIRAMLHAWEKFGLQQAEDEYIKRYNKKYSLKRQSDPNWKPSFKHVVRGKLEFLRMVRGGDNLIYLRFSNKLAQLDPDYNLSLRQVTPAIVPTSVYIMTEGKTDWKHLKAALDRFKASGEFTNLDIDFWTDNEETTNGDGALRQRCEILKDHPHEKIQIAIFDRDKPDVVKSITDLSKEYKNWGNRVYSFAIPVPSHRRETPEVCIELYYQDADIQRYDSSGRRLFLSTEFNKRTFRHKDLDLNCTDPSRFRPLLTIIGEKVFDREGQNVALSKDDFATHVLQQSPEFSDVDISEFRRIFEVISKIVSENR
jgi:RNA-directed DNA polymerase